jgi:DnaJ-class molecular chaperone
MNTINNHVVDRMIVTKHTCQRCYGTGRIVPGLRDVLIGTFRKWIDKLRCRRAVKAGREIECWSCRGEGTWEVWM